MRKNESPRTAVAETITAITATRMLAQTGGLQYKMLNPEVGLRYGSSIMEMKVPLAKNCPCCERVMANNLLPVIAVNNGDTSDDEETFDECDVVSVYRCTNCNSLFAVWSHHRKSQNTEEYSCRIKDTFPKNKVVTKFDECLKKLSPEFVSIYNQSEIAERCELDDIYGMGYRKAIEHLVTAFLKWNKQDISDNMPLSQKISLIKNNDIHFLAKGATWIGNDATHIMKRHPDKSIEDMKRFIGCLVRVIEMEITIREAKELSSN